jgi:glycine C-acetyltransferase
MLSNLVEFPAVPKGQARFRLQVMARHSQHDIVDAVQRLASAVSEATDDLAALENGTASIESLATDRPLGEMPEDHSDAVAIEPQSAAPDATSLAA